MDDLSAWVGRRQQSTETLDARLVRWLAATLDRDDLLAARDGDPLPPAWHWAFFNAIEPMTRLGRDGHPHKGGFLPATAQPRRMWAGSRLHWLGELRVGQPVERESTILKCEAKRGKSGELVLVTVGHRFSVGAALLLEEQHDIVYRDDASADERRALAELAAQARAGNTAYERRGEIVRELSVGPVQMFRYSAATFNGHRIHYDRDYTRDEELYPGLVVHGPLQATWLLGLARKELGGSLPERFDFRGRSPLFDGQTVGINARREGEDRLALWVTAQDGVVTLDATASGRAG